MLLAALKLHPYRLGFFLNFGLTIAIILSTATTTQKVGSPHTFSTLAGAFGFLLSVATLTLATQFKYSKQVIAGLLVGFAGVTSYFLYDQPLKGYGVFCLLLLSAMLLPQIELSHKPRANFFRSRLLLVLVGFSTFNWALVYLFQVSTKPLAFVAVLLSSLLNFALLAIDLYSLSKRKVLQVGESPAMSWVLVGLCMLALPITPWLMSISHKPMLTIMSQISLIVPAASCLLLAIRFSFRRRLLGAIEALFFHPEGSVIVLFFCLCCLGTLLLFLPDAAATGRSLNLIDAAFTAVSAVCVTGLNVVDFVRDFSGLGKVLVLILIQLGGLGIMTLSSLAVFVMGERMSINQETTLARISGQKIKSKASETLAAVLVFTFAVEVLGAALLTLGFMDGTATFKDSLWKGVFTAVSAFCNAGFALDADNLVGMKSNYLVLYTVGGLIILGGLSPAFVLAMPQMLLQQKISLQNRLILLTTVILLGLGFGLFGALEWNHSLAGMSVVEKIHNSWFQSVTTRTAGFNSVDIGAISQSTAVLMIILMFIGGSPGGTAGGVKTTTLAVAASLAFSVLRGEKEVTIFLRRIRSETVYKATATLIVSLGLGMSATVLLMVTQGIEGVNAAFEVFSALGTVGLSRGITPTLDSYGKAIIMACMFLGRVGPLSVLLFIFEQESKRKFGFPTEEVVVA